MKPLYLINDTFNISTLFLIGMNPEEAQSYIDEAFEDTEGINFEEKGAGYFRLYNEELGWLFVLWVDEYAKYSELYDGFMHEVSHLVFYAMQWLGIPITEDTIEVHAYLSGYFGKKVTEAIFEES